jgi:hypothetical protein
MRNLIWSLVLIFLLASCKATLPVAEEDTMLLMTQEEAIQLAQTHVADRAAVWSARFVEDYEMELSNEKKLYTLWVVEARFPAENREIYYIEALTGRLLLLSEQEAPRQKTPPPTKPQSEQPPTQSSGPLEMKPLKLNLIERDDGFQLQVEKEKGSNTLVVQSFVSPDPQKPVTHLVRRIEDRFRLDIVSVIPKDKTFKQHALVSVKVADEYSVDSIARAYGFLDPEHLVMVLPKPGKEEGRIAYDVASVNITNGQVTVLVENIPPDVSPDFFAKGWLSDDGSRLYLNSYDGGAIWMIDVKEGRVEKWDESLSHQWPIYKTVPSPDGERLWYVNDDLRLYDGDSRMLVKLPIGEGLHSYPAFRWSPDSKYSVYQYTRTNSPEHRLGEEEESNLAPQGIIMYDMNGRKVWETKDKEEFPNQAYVEWIGWLSTDSDIGIVHKFGLTRGLEGEPPRKTGSSYGLVQITTGAITPLTSVNQLQDLQVPVPVIAQEGQLLFVDASEGMYWRAGSPFGEDGKSMLLIPSESPDNLRWIEIDYNGHRSMLHFYTASQKNFHTNSWNETLGTEYLPLLINEEWVVDSKLVYRSLR